jgi:hypothetical protein
VNPTLEKMKILKKAKNKNPFFISTNPPCARAVHNTNWVETGKSWPQWPM